MAKMAKKQLLERLQRYSDAFGPAGFENDIALEIKKDVAHLVDDIIRDPIGNLIAIKREKARKPSCWMRIWMKWG